ncbi:glycosyltransferase, partial [Caulobacter sp.]|uniref:glycosyltransferase n=1 Tax=Caulobacter sp. TaxID=78 RepID=UPI002B4A11E6
MRDPTNRHLCFILPSLGSGGAERAVANLSSSLADRGHRVTVLVLRGGGAYEATMSPRVTVVNLGIGNARRVMPRLAREVRERQIDIVFSALFHL